MNRAVEIPRIWDDGIAVGVAGVGAAGTAVLALTIESEAFFHTSEVNTASSQVNTLKSDIHANQNAKTHFESADSHLRADATHYLDGVIANDRGQIQAITEHSPTYGPTQKVEKAAMYFGETVTVAVLVAVGVHKARNAMIRRAAKKHAANQTTVPIQTST